MHEKQFLLSRRTLKHVRVKTENRIFLYITKSQASLNSSLEHDCISGASNERLFESNLGFGNGVLLLVRTTFSNLIDVLTSDACKASFLKADPLLPQKFLK